MEPRGNVLCRDITPEDVALQHLGQLVTRHIRKVPEQREGEREGDPQGFRKQTGPPRENLPLLSHSPVQGYGGGVIQLNFK